MALSQVRKNWVRLGGTGDSFAIRLVPPSLLLLCGITNWIAKLQGCFETQVEMVWVLQLLLISWSCTHSFCFGWKYLFQFFSLCSFIFSTYILIHSLFLVSNWLVAWQSKITPFSLWWLLCTLTFTLSTWKNSLL